MCETQGFCCSTTAPLLIKIPPCHYYTFLKKIFYSPGFILRPNWLKFCVEIAIHKVIWVPFLKKNVSKCWWSYSKTHNLKSTKFQYFFLNGLIGGQKWSYTPIYVGYFVPNVVAVVWVPINLGLSKWKSEFLVVANSHPKSVISP